MKRLFPIFVVVTLVITFVVSTRVGTAQNDNGPELCATAANGGQVPGYEVVQRRGGTGNQIVLGTSAGETLTGGTGHDILCGFDGDDILKGGSGHDILVGGRGDDDLRGQSGNDTFFSDTDDSHIRGGSGSDRTLRVTPTATATNTATATATATATSTDTPITPSITVSFDGFTDAGCYVDIVLADFPAGTSGTYRSYYNGSIFNEFPFDPDYPSDSLSTEVFTGNTLVVTFEYNDATSGPVTIESNAYTCSPNAPSTATSTATATATSTDNGSLPTLSAVGESFLDTGSESYDQIVISGSGFEPGSTVNLDFDPAFETFDNGTVSSWVISANPDGEFSVPITNRCFTLGVNHDIFAADGTNSTSTSYTTRC